MSKSQEPKKRRIWPIIVILTVIVIGVCFAMLLRGLYRDKGTSNDEVILADKVVGTYLATIRFGEWFPDEVTTSAIVNASDECVLSGKLLIGEEGQKANLVIIDGDVIIPLDVYEDEYALYFEGSFQDEEISFLIDQDKKNSEILHGKGTIIALEEKTGFTIFARLEDDDEPSLKRKTVGKLDSLDVMPITDMIDVSPQQDIDILDPDGEMPEGNDNLAISGDGFESIEGVDFSTTSRPTLDEFAWYEDESSEVWNHPTDIVDPSVLEGSYKCYIVYDPYRTMDSYARELANVDISLDGENAALTIDWYEIYWDGSAPFNEENSPDTTFTGTCTNGEIYVTSVGNIYMSNHYYFDGHQYVLGAMTTQDGIVADVVLMRP